MTYEMIEKANAAIRTMTISHEDKRTGKTVSKEYAEVNQRIKAFRMLYPEGFIRTALMSNEDGVCIFQAIAGYWDEGEEKVLATGTAYEREDSTFINKTSYIENCETSAVGRALGMLGLGIDTSVASYEEVSNAVANQPEERKASPKQIEVLKKFYQGDNLKKLLEVNNIEKIEDLTLKKASELIGKINKKGDK